MEIAWHSDPIHQAAMALTILLLAGIFYLFITIVEKHRSRLISIRVQRKFNSHLNQAISLHERHCDFHAEITMINSLIANHKKEVANAWMRLLEKTPIAQRQPLVAIAKHSSLLQCIPHCLYEEGLAERCIALEAIGLSGFNEYALEVAKFTNDEGVSAYACIALARLKQIEALPLILAAYDKKILTTTQALSALTEIPSPELKTYLTSHHGLNVPAQLSVYLEVE